MRYLNGCTFGFMSPRGFTQGEDWKTSLELMARSTLCDTVVLPVAALQDHAYSTHVDYETPDVMSMDDVRAVAAQARALGLRVVVKAMVNCRDGYWRAYIRFFDSYVPTEPTWADWFASYGDFVVALARTAQEVDADMFCVGCEMVGADHRQQEWRALIARVRQVYAGPITYNCDKYQEGNITWWDAVDVISSSGYYPVDQLEEHFLRVQQVAAKFHRPFFFMESGCPSRKGSEYIPNNWSHGGAQDLESQARWYQAYTDALLRHPGIRGSVWWDWSARLYPLEKAANDSGYALYGKPAADILRRYSRAVAQREAPATLGEELKAHLTDKILPFWQRLADWENGGFYGRMEQDLTRDPQAHKGGIYTSRILWAFSTAARVLEDPALLPYARHAYDFLTRFEDPEQGGVYWSLTHRGEPLDRTKHTYCQAFAIYGLSAYARATGLAEPLEKAMALFRVIESRCTDPSGYGEAYHPDFTPVSNEKLSDNGIVAARTMNTLLHVLEAYAELYRAGGGEDVRAAGEACLQQFLNVIYNRNERRLEVFFDQDGRSMLNMQSFGHDVEASWLMWDAVECLIPQDKQAPYKAMCIDLARSVLERAMTGSGLNNEMVDGVTDATKIWWVQAEALLGFMNACAITGDEVFSAAARSVWAATQRLIVDPRPGGEWFWAVRDDGTPTGRAVAEEWKAPYHNSRMCLRIMEKEKE